MSMTEEEQSSHLLAREYYYYVVVVVLILLTLLLLLSARDAFTIDRALSCGAVRVTTTTITNPWGS